MPSADSDMKSKAVERYDEYTYFADSTQTLADRRQSATQVFIGVNTSIFGLIGFLLNDAGLSRMQDLVALPLFVVGVLICLVWDRMISHYRALIAWRFEQLRSMENELNGSYKMFTREWEMHFQPQTNKSVIGFSNLERSLPHIVLGLYVAYGLAFLIAKIFDL